MCSFTCRVAIKKLRIHTYDVKFELWKLTHSLVWFLFRLTNGLVHVPYSILQLLHNSCTELKIDSLTRFVFVEFGYIHIYVHIHVWLTARHARQYLWHICLYMNIHVHIHIHTYTCTCIYTYTCVAHCASREAISVTHISIHEYTRTRIYTYISIHEYTRNMNTYTYIYMYVSIYVWDSPARHTRQHL